VTPENVTPENVTPVKVERLTKGQLSEVLALVEAATLADGVAPLSEQVLLDARETLPGSSSRTDTEPSSGPDAGASSDPDARENRDPATTSGHFLAYAGACLAGYAHLDQGLAGPAGPAEATGELVVAPAHRRHGVGTALVDALEDALKNAPEPQDRTLRLWSHGNLDAVRALALRGGYSEVRELWQMRRSLLADVAPLPAVSVPDGFETRQFVVGQDEEAWLRVNARAFADHPEQGRITRHDLDRRIAEPWFDASGFILIEDVRGRVPVLAASHWTKVVPTADSPARSTVEPTVRATEGEVYVVGVDPAYQGLGLGRTVTVLGLEHLRDQGLTEATLYVDADNRAAVATYSRLDFAVAAVDIMYSRTVHTPV
jgi:mycothiol synthase